MQEEKEVQLCKKRLIELANTSFYKGYSVFTDFLTLKEQTIFNQIQSELPNINYKSWGGTDLAERKMICFSSDLLTVEQFPITVLKIQPQNLKYAEQLTHRDFLGAILNLGVDRCKVGDILLNEKIAYAFIEENMADFFVNSLEKVKHTKVRCEIIKEDFQFEQKFKEVVGTVNSIRLDAVLAIAFHSSRSQLLKLITSGKIYVNGCLVEHNSYHLKAGDLVSARGLGKFMYVTDLDKTKKGKTKILLRIYT